MTDIEIIQQIKQIVNENEPTAQVYLYGSQARGDSKKTSDWDLLILLNQENISSETERKITYPLYDLEFEIGEIISPMVYSKKEWEIEFNVF